jgi:glutathione synthase/RimK-type ligase-like ATP-grasp enzyme
VPATTPVPCPQVVLLVTFAGLPDGEEWAGTSHLPAAFAERGIDARWVRWDDPEVDWTAGLVAVRSTWDYGWRREEFLAWARSVPWMLNSAALFEWNTDKSYLPELAAAGVPVVPTILVEDESGLPAAIAESSADPDRPGAVVKPTVGAGGRGVVVFDGAEGGHAGLDESGLGPGPWVVQPLVESVRTEGETSVFVLDGQVVSQVQKVPAAGEIRVHEEYGGTTVAVAVTEEAAGLARRAVEAAASLTGRPLDYARVDQMRLADGTLAVSELEVTEPGLYLEVLPQNAVAFADLVVSRLRPA